MAEHRRVIQKSILGKQPKSASRISLDNSLFQTSESLPMKSFSSFNNALSTRRLFKRKQQADATPSVSQIQQQPLQEDRVSPELGSDVNLLSSPNDTSTRKQSRRRRRSSTAILRRRHRHRPHRHQRDASASDADRRSVMVRRKRNRYPTCGINAPPRHVHGNDWREMMLLTEKNLAVCMRKSEGDLESGELVRRNDTRDVNEALVATSSMRSLDDARLVCASSGAPTVRYGGTIADTQRAFEARERIERLAHSRNFSGGSSIQHIWIEETFCKRECSMFIPSSRDPNKCGCGRLSAAHSAAALLARSYADGGRRAGVSTEKWAISKHTQVSSTDSYGTIEFQGGPHPFKAQYLRLNFDSEPADIMLLFEHVWQIPPPKLIITVHGGITNFDLQPKLARVFRKGLLKAARTTGAWIFTTGINAGVVRHVAAALEGALSSSKSRAKIVTVGIAPWGLLRKREDFLGKDKVVMYHPHSFPPKGRLVVLNNRSSFFLLVDNGTVGRYGADIILRRRLESYIAEKQKIDSGGRSVPVVCVVLEGGTCAVRTVLDYVTRIPKVPVVVCDGSGRASDLIAFAHQYVQEDGNLPEKVRPQLLRLIEAVFSYDKANAQCLVLDILACVRQKHMITIFRLGENQKQDVDYSILTALLKGQNLSPAEQLSLALAWNRVDIARSDIFVMGQDWPKSALHNAMLEAFIHNRVDFVRLLLENGVSMHDFLTIGRLEELYNTDQGPPNTLYYIVRDVVKIRPGYRYKLIHIGMAIEKLMANGFRSHYTSSEFRHRYMSYRNKCKEVLKRKRELSNQRSTAGGDEISNFNYEMFTTNFAPNIQSMPHNNSSIHVENEPHLLPAISGSRALSNHILWRSAYRRDNFVNQANMIANNMQQNKDTVIDMDDELFYEMEESRRDFKYPFSDLLIWAVLTKRHDMALCMWQHGEEAMAKALVACRLYKSLAKEAAEDYLEVEICDELKKYAEEFRLLSLDLLDHCYKQDDAQTLQLLTYELSYWGYETCLSLSVIVNNKQFLAHPCCQILLADLWHGGLRIRSNSNLKVILGLLFPPSIFLLEFKSREELMLQPQTAAEHEQDINYSSSSSSSSESSSSSSSSDSESENEISSMGADKRHPPPLATSGGGLDVEMGGVDRRRGSSTSVQSLNLANLFHSKRRKHNRTQHNNAHQPQVNKSSSVEKTVEQKEPTSSTCEDILRVPDSVAYRPPSATLSPGGAMALSVTNIIGAVSTPTASLSTTSIAKAVEKEDLKASHHLNVGAVVGQELKETANDMGIATNSDSKIQQTQNQITSAPVRITPPAFIIGADDAEEEKYSYKEKMSSPPSVNRRFLNSVQKESLNHAAPELKGKSARAQFVKKASIALPKGIPLPTSLTFSRRRQIKFRRKVYEFFVAPITTFWAWTLSFVAFLIALTYVLLIRTPVIPACVEWYLLAYVITFGLETIRKFIMSEPKNLNEKAAYFFANYWNFITSVAIIGFLIGFGFRVNPSTRSIGRVILAVDSVLWSLKLLDFLGVHSRFGPYITMAAKMVMNMSSMIVMLLISLLAFGLVRQSITYPEEEWNWLLVRNIFYKPYFMLYGEVYADEIDVCGDEAWDDHLENHTPINSTKGDACVPGHWIPPLLMTVFLLIGNILLISMLIAIFNNIFDQTIKISQQIWLFQRYRQVMEYESTPFLPPPFTPIYHIFMLLKYLRWRYYCFSTQRSIFCRFSALALCCSSCRMRRRNAMMPSTSAKSEGTQRMPRERGAAQPSQQTTTNNTNNDNNCICKRVGNSSALFDFSLKLFLSEDQVEKLHDFEEECMEDMARDKEIERARSNEERLHRTAERTDLILTRVTDLTAKETQLKSNIRELETRLETMELKQGEIFDCMQQIVSTLPSIVQSLQNLSVQAQLPPKSSTTGAMQQQNIAPSTFFVHETSPSLVFRSPPHSPHIENAHSFAFNSKSVGRNTPATIEAADETPSPSSTNNVFSAPNISKHKSVRPPDNFDRHQTTGEFMMGSDASSQATIFHPLSAKTPLSAGRIRSRTTTIGENETHFPPASQAKSRLFGSVVSLNQNIAPSAIPAFQKKKNGSIRRRRQHDEYTSITDAIDIDNILMATLSTYSVKSTTAVVPQAESGDDDYDDDVESVLDPPSSASASHRPIAESGRRNATIKSSLASNGRQNSAVVVDDDILATEDDADVEEDDEEEDLEEEDMDEEEDDNDGTAKDEYENEEYEFHISTASINVALKKASLDGKTPQAAGNNAV